MGNLHTYVLTKDLKKKTFVVKIWNVKQAIGIQMTFILENKHQKEQLFGKMLLFFQELMYSF